MLTINMHHATVVEHRDHDDFFTTCITDDKGNTVTLFFMTESDLWRFWQDAANAHMTIGATGEVR